jgi:hypothetical protein
MPGCSEVSKTFGLVSAGNGLLNFFCTVVMCGTADADDQPRTPERARTRACARRADQNKLHTPTHTRTHTHTCEGACRYVIISRRIGEKATVPPRKQTHTHTPSGVTRANKTNGRSLEARSNFQRFADRRGCAVGPAGLCQRPGGDARDGPIVARSLSDVIGRFGRNWNEGRVKQTRAQPSSQTKMQARTQNCKQETKTAKSSRKSALSQEQLRSKTPVAVDYRECCGTGPHQVLVGGVFSTVALRVYSFTKEVWVLAVSTL